MGKYIDWYLVELESRLQGAMRPDEVHDLVSQTAAHLRDSSEQLESTGMTAKESELASLEKFGRVTRIAEEAAGNRSQRLVGSWAVLAAFAFGTASAVWWYFGHGQDWFALWLSAAVFALGAMMARRLMWRELGALAGLAFVGIAIFFGVSYSTETNMTRPELLKLASTMDSPIAGIPAEVQRFERTFGQFEKAPANAKLYNYPGTALYYDEAGQQAYPIEIQYSSSRSWDFASREWRKGAQLPAKLRTSQAALTALQASLVRKSESSFIESATSHASLAFAWSACLLVLGLAANAAFAPVSRLWTGRSRMYRKYA
jgi:hypothetical protein